MDSGNKTKVVKTIRIDVDQRAIVIGAGLAGMTAALSLADQGFEVALIERASEPGGMARTSTSTSSNVPLCER